MKKNMVRQNSFVLAFSFSTALALLLPVAVNAQLTEGLLLAADPLGSGSRGMAMGGNLISAANGVDALEFNPAALAPIGRSDFTLSLFNREHSSTATFLGNPTDASVAQFSLSSIGIAYKYPTVVGHLAMGVSFDHVQDYTSSYKFSAVNQNSSLFNTQGFLYGPANPYTTGNRDYLWNNNLAYGLGLTYDVPDSGTYKLTTPFTKGGLLQSGTVTTEGGLNAVRIGGGIDIAEGVSFGATINLLFGTYDYNRTYSETNVNNISTGTDTVPPSNFQKATITDMVHQDQSGASLKLGLLVDEKIVRFGVTIETPQAIHVVETYSRSGNSSFGGPVPENWSYVPFDPYSDEYDVITPMRLGAGASVHALGFTGSASISYTDMAQLHFQSPSVDMSAQNQVATDSLRAVLSWQLGAEYKIPGVGIAIRAGFAYEPSPWKGDASSYDTKVISAGVGIPIGKRFAIDAVFRHSSFNAIHPIYNDLTPDGTAASANITSDAVTQSDFAMTFQYKF
jgi:hypothetical protein